MTDQSYSGLGANKPSLLWEKMPSSQELETLSPLRAYLQAQIGPAKFRVSIQFKKIRNEKGDIRTETEEIKKSLDSITKAYIQHNWKICMKWTAF